MKRVYLLSSPLLILFALISVRSEGQELLYLNTDLPAEERAEDLVSRMSLEEKISQMQNGAAAIPELGIPEYDWWNECLHGVARNGIATVFPQAIGMAATWNPDLKRRSSPPKRGQNTTRRSVSGSTEGTRG
jgi:beta-glucosidase